MLYVYITHSIAFSVLTNTPRHDIVHKVNCSQSEPKEVKMSISKDEQLLSAWLCLCGRVKNDRLVEGMSFNEIFVCNILHGLKRGEAITASDIVTKTGMLKSQVNKVLSGLEAKSIISRKTCQTDKRRIEIMLTKEGALAYAKEHEHVLALVQKLRDRIGEGEIDNAIDTLNLLADAMRDTMGS